MNIRKIKLALTVGLMNQESNNALQVINDLMGTLRDEVGIFLGLKELPSARLSPNAIEQRYALQYERVTLNIDLISNPKTHTQVVRHFQVG